MKITLNKLEVINVKNYEDTDYIYIGRPSDYGNPYASKHSNIALKKVNSKTDALILFEEYINKHPELVDQLIKEMRESLTHKLGCWCKPSRCHGDILVQKIKERLHESII